MHRSRSLWHLGMPHTICGALSEVALFAHAADLHWKSIATLTGCPASRLVDAAGDEVYASVFFAGFEGGGDQGLASFRPDDELELVGTLGRYGASMLDGMHRLYPAGSLPAEIPDSLPAAPLLRLSFVLVSPGDGPDALRISTPANAQMDRIPPLTSEPDTYRIVKRARAAGGFVSTPGPGRQLWSGTFSRAYPINADRDLNGVGLLYFANYIVFLDAAERDALQERAGLTPERLDGRVTLWRRIAYYGNARSSDRLDITVEAYARDGEPDGRLLVLHQVRRVSDGRLIALAGAERRLRVPPSSEALEERGDRAHRF
jgi:probable biosynthetic protein (TIGR04098 family)